MSNMNRPTPNRNKKVEIPVMSNTQITSLWSQRAENIGGSQLFRDDGRPLIGAIYPNSTSTRKYKNNIGDCRLDCCSVRRPLVSGLPGLAPRPSSFPEPGEPEFTGWVRVEPRSVRRLKTRARFQKDTDQHNYERPSVFYAMTD
jgi:hypothetical protein